MFKLTASARARERCWKLLKAKNPKLSKAAFNDSYDNTLEVMKILNLR